MKNPERWFSVLLGLSFIGSGLTELFLQRKDVPVVVLFGTSSLLIVVGAMALKRSDAKRHGSMVDLIVASPSMVVAALVFVVAPAQWSLLSQSVFVLGTMLAIVSFFWLGKSFAVMPAVRELKTIGPYSVVRHPAYLGELILVGGCCLAIGGWKGGICLITCVLLVAARIFVEEKLLSKELGYAEYSQKVRWRLVPWVW